MIKADLKVAGILADEFTFHSPRHTYSSLINATKADQKTMMELSRHSDPRLTFGTYVHTRLEEMGRVVDTLPPLWDAGWKTDRLAVDRKSKSGNGEAVSPELPSPVFPIPECGKSDPLCDFSPSVPHRVSRSV